MIEPPRWSEDELTTEAARSVADFRRERLDEPREQWKAIFDECEAEFRKLFDTYAITAPQGLTPQQVAALFRDKLGNALRYLAAPPISADDLKVLAEASLAPKRIAADAQLAQRIIAVIMQAIDPKRFPWIIEGRTPTREEKEAAILASSALHTAQRVSTARRNKGKADQEEKVKTFLLSLGFTQVPSPKRILPGSVGLLPGQFCGETMVGSRKADVPVRLRDGRMMPIECKVSNSSTNSVKRINNDAQVKAGVWKSEFGSLGVVPTAMLAGVFKVHNLTHAQEHGLTLFWSHKLDDLKLFLEAALP